MADNSKKYADWIDIPDGNGGTERKYFRDAEAQAAIERLEQEVSQLDPASAASVQTCEAIVEELT